MNVTQHDATTAPHQVCVIFAAGQYYAERPEVPAGAFVVAADGGYDHANELGVTPDVVIGDFDSIAQLPDTTDTIALPAQKDETDMPQAVKIGWNHGIREFHLYGGLGGRIDHSLANLQLLAGIAQHGGIGFLHGNGTVVTAIANGELTFAANQVAERRMVSVFAHSDHALGVTIRGLKYETQPVDWVNSHALGVSNEFLPGVASSISVREGTLIITYPAEAPAPEWNTSVQEAQSFGEIDDYESQLLSPLFRQ
ncbi:thiamine diphosphokinase [Bifidobacterium oedipodis]|uniref:Thiamine diphosphokinase n=1 Tax=Bifidobacterium oedipodis TaxID=2675322 RepID=A0A7Y0HRK9_9BIFI|nr:thiamine diphosphokinase [Bifidobacterium sp. DSM 109957]NMM92986.1 thiamine pyrophosphokinase [Bifidobacterium sp. DSM 109957]